MIEHLDCMYKEMFNFLLYSSALVFSSLFYLLIGLLGFNLPVVDLDPGNWLLNNLVDCLFKNNYSKTTCIGIIILQLF